ncbi:MAG: hypothetical protein U5R06_12735 [candidate division KSB1 bacterium]|nr:hypothetical protein [candidate division KSB1 bacterium]
MINRRDFFNKSMAGLSVLGLSSLACQNGSSDKQAMTKGGRIRITDVDADFEREPLIRPFGFKGGYMTEIWQTIARMSSGSGHHSIGLCTQNVLWSDSAVFASHSESGGNALMYALSERALQMAKGQSFDSPVDLLDAVLEEVYKHGKEITDNPDLRKTFALNALVGFDNAAWLLYAKEHGITDFDALIPETYKPALSHHHEKVASIPLMAYSIPISEIRDAADRGLLFS